MSKLTAEHLLNLISDAHAGLITYINTDYRYEFASKEYLNWFGIRPQEMIGRKVAEVVGADNFADRKPLMDLAFKGEQVKFTNTVNHTLLGNRYVEQIYKPDIQKDGTVDGIIVIAYDVTERVKTERAFQENEARFRSLTENLPALVWVANPDGSLIWFNENWMRNTGTTLEESLGDGWLKVLHPDDRQPTLNNWHEGMQTRESKAAVFRLKMKDGSYRWHMGRAFPVLSEKGELLRWVGTTFDIEEQKSAKDIAELERKKIYSLFMQAPLIITVTSGPNHIYELVNTLTYKYFPGRELIGKPFKEVLSDLDQQGFGLMLDDIYHSGDARSYSSILVNVAQPDGGNREVFADLYFEPIKDEQGHTIGILSLGVDVTERVHALKRAEESENQFRNYVESMPQMAFTANPEGKFTYFNQRWSEYTAQDIDSLKLWQGSGMHHPDDLKRTIERWNHSVNTGENYEIEYRLKRKDGVYRWHLGRAVPIRDSKGNITQWVGTNTDIHDQKEIEAYQTRLLQVLESSSDFIGMSDKEGHCIYLNEAAFKMLGLDPEAKTDNVAIMNFFFDEDKDFVEKVIIPTTMKDGKWVGDFKFKHFKTGEPVWVHYNSFITHDETTGEFTGFATVSRNMGEIKQKERKLEEALKARDHFLSIASHELKTPLTSLKLQSQLTLRNIAAKKEITYDKIIATAVQNNELVDRLTHLIDDMLDVSRINTGKLKLNKSVQEVGDLLREVLFRLAILFEAAGLKLPTIEADGKYYGEWDRFRMEQVIGNLLTNAIRYGRGNLVEIKIRGKGNQVVFSVTDYGYGISEEDQRRIFERFERAINASEVSGLGLGLFISKEIVEAHDGKIWVESEVNKGSTFFVSLPLTEAKGKI